MAPATPIRRVKSGFWERMDAKTESAVHGPKTAIKTRHHLTLPRNMQQGIPHINPSGAPKIVPYPIDNITIDVISFPADIG
jgi:hypothetical protein